MPTTTNSELIAILRSRKTPGALTKMNRKQLEALVESTGEAPRRPNEPDEPDEPDEWELYKLLNQERTEVARHIKQNHLEQDEYLKERIAEEEDENQQLEKIVHGHLKTIEELKTKHSQEIALIAGRSAEYKKELTEFKEKLENVEEELETTEEDVEYVIAFANQEKEKLVEKIEELRDYIELGEDKNEIDVFNKIFNGTDGDDLSDEE